MVLVQVYCEVSVADEKHDLQRIDREACYWLTACPDRAPGCNARDQF